MSVSGIGKMVSFAFVIAPTRGRRVELNNDAAVGMGIDPDVRIEPAGVPFQPRAQAFAPRPMAAPPGQRLAGGMRDQGAQF